MTSPTIVNHDLNDGVIALAEFEDQLLTMTLTGTAGSVTDTTTYPVATQATKTELITIDGGSAQTVTFTTAIDRGSVTDTTTYPVTDQDTKTEKVTIDGGSEQTVTFATTLTTAAGIAAVMDAQLTGCAVTVVGGQIVITSDSQGASSSVAIGTGTADLTWATPADVNTAADVAQEINAQITGGFASVASGQVKITSDSTGTSSSVAIGTGTADLTWDTAVAGTGDSGVVSDNTLVALNTSTLKLVPYVKGGSTNGNGAVYGVITQGFTATATGDTAVRVAIGPGLRLLKDKTVIHADAAATNIDAAVKLLCVQVGINLVESTNLHTADNS